VKTDFTATAEAQDPQSGAPKKVSLVFHLEQSNAVIPKSGAATPATPATPATKTDAKAPATPAKK
jgi:hypothetical protein